MTKKQKKALTRIISSSILLIFFSLIPIEGYVKFICLMIPYFIIGYDILKKAFKGILNRQVFDENFLMAVATIGAIILKNYTEGVAVMLFYQIGEFFQSYAVGKSRQSISDLMDIRPDYANVEQDGTIVQVDPDEISIGSTIIVKPGEKIPIDGIIQKGNSSLNTIALTGESLPREVTVGNEVLSGSININGVLYIKTTKEFGDSTAAKILDLVENASSKKSKSENFISKFARVYTPAVCSAALALAILPPLVNILFSNNSPNWNIWIYRALTFLVISCPCALVISIPLTFFAGIGSASKSGILIKGSSYLETLSNVSTIVFDKTGTLTHGTFEVTGIHHNILEDKKLLEYAAYAESYSNHPISLSLKKAYGKDIDETRVSDVQEISGHGIIAKIDKKEIAVGNSKLMKKLNIAYKDCHNIGTIIHIAIDNSYAGHIVISDVIKPNSKEAISLLKKVGIKKTIMLTGDRQNTANSVAKELNIDETYSELLPADKVSKVEQILSSKKSREKVAFVGDGINDAPVLSRADIGIAMGALGSDAAIEAADIVLMDDDPIKISTAIKLSRKCLRIVYENIYFALAVKFICLILGALGIANMWLAIFADVGVMILAVLNSIRILYKNKKGR